MQIVHKLIHRCPYYIRRIPLNVLLFLLFIILNVQSHALSKKFLLERRRQYSRREYRTEYVPFLVSFRDLSKNTPMYRVSHLSTLADREKFLRERTRTIFSFFFSSFFLRGKRYQSFTRVEKHAAVTAYYENK